MRVLLVTASFLLLLSSPAWAERQIKPFLGVTFGGSTTFIDLEHAAGSPNVAFGCSGVLLGEAIGIEADFGRAPGFFQTGDEHLIVRSAVTTLTGNIIVLLPRHLAEYTLRPYFVGGAGLMRVHFDDLVGVLRVASNLPATDVGGGVTGFLTNRIGLSWDVRYFRSLGVKDEGGGVSFGGKQLSFWRANMALAIRY